MAVSLQQGKHGKLKHMKQDSKGSTHIKHSKRCEHYKRRTLRIFLSEIEDVGCSLDTPGEASFVLCLFLKRRVSGDLARSDR